MTKSNDLRVFISSTFRDLQEEREHLIKKIFPEIRSLCRQRGITFTEVDLRWGLTEDEATLGRIIRTCLEEVDKCRPYFIGMIGNRYGWAPEFHEILMDPDLLTKYPWIEEVAIDGASVTEMEFIHGVFDAPEVDGEYAFFYHRSGDISEADNPERLAALINRSRATGRPFREFEGVDQLGQQVHDDLLAMIDRYWPQTEAPSALELERRAHAAFAASRVRAYIPNPLYLKEFTRWLGEGEKPLVVRGESGLGKSSLVAYLVEHYRKKNPTALVIVYYVGASSTSGSATSVMRHVVEEIRERFAITDELPAKEEELEKSFPNWLFRCEQMARDAGVPVLIVVDALNQLSESGQRLTWLPQTIPSGVKLMISTTPGETDQQLAEREWEQLNVTPLADERVRQSIVVRYLGEFHKGITSEQVRRVTSDAKGSSPLYLRVVAEELRLHGEHEALEEVIARYVTAEDLLQVFERVLQRMETDFGSVPVRDLLSAIWGSRAGLSETELMEITRMSRLELSRLLFALDYHLIQRDGLLGFFHDYLRRAVEKRYLGDVQQQQMRTELARYFERVEITARSASELIYQHRQSESWEKLAETLSRMERFLALWHGEMIYEVLGDWRMLGEQGIDIETRYSEALAGWAPEQQGSRLKGLQHLADLYQRVGRWAAAAELFAEMIALSQVEGDRAGTGTGHRGLGAMRVRQGRYEEAMEDLTTARAIYEELGKRSEMSNAIGIMGLVYDSRGEYEQALECFGQQEAISRELDDRTGVSKAMGGMGNVYSNRGEYNQALECFGQSEAISRELGDRNIIAGVVNNVGNVYYRQGRYDEALQQFEQALAINRSIGNRHWIAINLGGMGLVYFSRGEYDAALKCYTQLELICRELGDRNGIAGVLQNIGLVYSNQGQLLEALHQYEQALEINRSIGNRSWIAYNHAAIGTVYTSRGEYDAALESFRQQETICREIGDRSGMSYAIGSIGGLYARRGEYEAALDRLRHAAEEHQAIGDRNALSNWLQTTAEVLLELVATAAEMPEYLPRYVPGASVGTWKAMSVAKAREVAEENVAISQELKTQDTVFSGHLLLARIEAAEGGRDVALQRLTTLLAEAANDEQRAECHYQFWKLDASDSNDHRTEALRLFQTLVEKTPKHEYRKRIEELSGAANPPETTDAIE